MLGPRIVQTISKRRDSAYRSGPTRDWVKVKTTTWRAVNARAISGTMKKRTTQVAALPIRIRDDGEINVLLVSSRETKRWVIPKGWPSKKMGDAKAAAREAREEAGVTGKVYRKPVGFYRYRKVLPESSRILDVAVYALWVRKLRKFWERGQAVSYNYRQVLGVLLSFAVKRS
jgi:8-oxo-dGTP pyrophosphatase MutT (NUDIX family)